MSDYRRNISVSDQRRKESRTSVFKIENFVSNPSNIPFPDGLETELSVSKWRFFCNGIII